jgi:ketosteroid isomerase-like protein
MPDNKAFVQSLYAAFGRGDIPFILAHADETIAWSSNDGSGAVPWGGPRQGRQEVQHFFDALAAHLEFEVFDPRRFAAEGDLVFVQGRTVAKVKATGRRFDMKWVHLFTIEGNRVKRFEEFYDTAVIVPALGR